MNRYGCSVKSKVPLVMPLQCFDLYVPGISVELTNEPGAVDHAFVVPFEL